MLAAAASCSQERRESVVRDATDAGPELNGDFCGTIGDMPDPPFENAKTCYMAACERGDLESCELAATYNGNLFADGASSKIDDAQSRLIDGLKLASRDRPIDPDEVLSPYREAGLIGESPDLEADYNAYYRVRKPTRFLDYPLLAFETETMRAAGWIGCCIDEGVSILIRSNGEDARAEEFAQKYSCRLDRGDFAGKAEHFGQLGIMRLQADQTDIVLISCHTSDGR